MIRAEQAREVSKRYKKMVPVLDEQSRRRFVALEAQSLGRGGVSLMSRITGLARRTIYRVDDIRNNRSVEPGRVRNKGGGRKKKILEDPSIVCSHLLRSIGGASRCAAIGLSSN